MMPYQDFGLQFNPFMHLDSTKDAHLYEYLVIPKTVEIAWGDAPATILAQPGGGKSALRCYTEMTYRGTRGIKLPITYIPNIYSTQLNFHFFALSQSLARSVLIYLISYPDIFLQFSTSHQQITQNLLSYLPFELEFILDILDDARSITELETLLDSHAISGIEKPGKAHREMARLLRSGQGKTEKEMDIIALLAQTREVFKITSFHILVDGLDGFIETADKQSLLEWIEPLFGVAEAWAQNQVYLKLFLPLTLSDFPEIASHAKIRIAALTWDDGLLAEVIRRRLYVASSGAYDSLDALSTPDLRNVELRLARQLPSDQKNPRQIIRKTCELLERASYNPDRYIHYQDVFPEEKRIYVS